MPVEYRRQACRADNGPLLPARDVGSPPRGDPFAPREQPSGSLPPAGCPHLRTDAGGAGRSERRDAEGAACRAPSGSDDPAGNGRGGARAAGAPCRTDRLDLHVAGVTPHAGQPAALPAKSRRGGSPAAGSDRGIRAGLQTLPEELAASQSLLHQPQSDLAQPTGLYRR